MEIISLLLALTAILATTVSAKLQNHTQEFHLKTTLKPGQAGKESFDNLYLEAYHTGAGENDAVMLPKGKGVFEPAFLNGTNGEVDGIKYQNVVFDLGNPFPWTMVMADAANFYAAWEPVRVNAGGGASNLKGDSGFFINGTGLQWTTTLNQPPTTNFTDFGGWLVCDWWHGTPQLFFRIPFYSEQKYPAPCSCADVWLCPEYI